MRPYLALLVLALIAFWPLVLHPTETLYSNHSDLLAQHIPAKYFLVRSLRETGELPLWNPEQYAGSPPLDPSYFTEPTTFQMIMISFLIPFLLVHFLEGLGGAKGRPESLGD